MAIRTAYALHSDYPEWAVETVEVPVGVTLKVGDLVVAEALKAGSKKVYAGTVVSNAATEKPLLVIDQRFVEMADGRRVEGSNLLTDLAFTAGMRITAIRPVQDMKYEISQDSIGNTGVVAPAYGVFLVPSATGQGLVTSATIGTALVAYKIETLASIPTGGNLALGYSASVIARCVKA